MSMDNYVEIARFPRQAKGYDPRRLFKWDASECTPYPHHQDACDMCGFCNQLSQSLEELPAHMIGITPLSDMMPCQGLYCGCKLIEIGRQ